jgi:glutamate formiminotransferase/formiminotetrahydrofolate cyclodeaminase
VEAIPSATELRMQVRYSGTLFAHMTKLVEIVPNFSEGRRGDVIEAIVEALSVPGVRILNRQADPDHNRLDVSLVGDPEAVRRSALAGAAKAVELIDMDQHRGSHPRMGAVDVIPFLPIRELSMEDCIALAREVAREIGERLGIPVYCYDQAALSPDRRSLADVRKGEYEGLKADVAAGRRLPDFGPHELGRAGAVAVGARKPLIAFNIYLSGDDESAAKEIARRVRESSGGLANVRAIGFFVPERGCLTVSMNLVDYEATPVHEAFDAVIREAKDLGLEFRSSEIVGLVPQAALSGTAIHYLGLEGFDPATQVLERVIETAGGNEPTLAGFLDALASDSPTPGGGTAAAIAGAAGAALVAMVARLTIGKKAYQAVQESMEGIVGQAEEARAAFERLAERDARAFDAVIAAFRLPKETEEQKSARAEAIDDALSGAAEVPLEVARRAVAMMAAAVVVTEAGNASAASDGVTAAHLLAAAVEGALANVEINLSGMKASERAAAIRREVEPLRRAASSALRDADRAFRARL